MKKLIIYLSLVLLITFLIFGFVYYRTGSEVLLSLTITFGTINYHFVMRLLVGYAYNLILNNKSDYNKKWFVVHGWEKHLYKKLNVKKWKEKMPTFDTSLFNPELHSWSEIIGAMCQAELVHETIIVLSFVPIVAGIWFGEFPVFILTSFLAALFDLCFVIIQRYNRPRVMKVMERAER